MVVFASRVSRQLYSCFLAHLGAVSLLLGLMGMLTDVQAGPLVFEFGATISDIDGDVGLLNLPFSLAIGQEIAGTYSFQSEEDLLDIFLHHERGKLAQVSLMIDDMGIDAVTNLGLLNSAGVLDPPIVGPTSSIHLGYLSPTDVVPGWPGTVAGNAWNQRLTLLGADGTITASEHLLDVGVWNQLTLLRRLELQFGYPSTVSVRAVVGTFTAVPEPRSTLLISSIMPIAMAYFLFSRQCAMRHLV